MSTHDSRDEEFDKVDIKYSSKDQKELNKLYAFGLQLDPETGLPKVTAIGRGRIAKEMLRKASEAGLPVEKDAKLVNKMFRPVDDRAVPTRTYEVIAEILTFIYQVNEEFKREEILQEQNDLEEEALEENQTKNE